MCHWPRMGHNGRNQAQKPLVILSLCLLSCLLAKSPSSAPAEVQICVGSLLARQLKSRPHCPCRHHRPRRHQFVTDQSMCVFSVVIIPEESHLIDAKSNFAPAILNLMHAKSNLEVGSASPLTHLVDLYIFI